MTRQERINKTNELLEQYVGVWYSSGFRSFGQNTLGTICYPDGDKTPVLLKDIIEGIVVLAELKEDCKTPNGHTRYAMWNDLIQKFVSYGSEEEIGKYQINWTLEIGVAEYSYWEAPTEEDYDY